METVADFIFLGSKITIDGDCSHEIKRGLFRGRKAMPNINSILKSSHFRIGSMCVSEIKKKIIKKIKIKK